jgi:large conductance mechanosensitive channel
MKKLLKEFKKFISRGNVIELAVGLIMATYFGAIVKSFVDDIIMPPVGYLIAGVDFADLKLKIADKVLADGTVQAVTINYGAFINTVITFFIVSAAIFMVARMYNNFMKKEEIKTEPKPAPPSKEELILSEIRDLLKEQNPH